MIKKKSFCVLVLLASLFWSFYISAKSVVAYSASISTTGSVSLDMSTAANGIAIEADTVNVTSDCRAGYTLSATTPKGSNLYRYENDTQASDTASFTSVDGTSALNSSNNSDKWGYTLSDNPSGSTVFSPLSTTPAVLKTPADTASQENDIDDTFSVYYGAKTGSDVDPGNYKMTDNGTIVYFLTMDIGCMSYSLQYDGNGADNSDGMGVTNTLSGEKSVQQLGFDVGTEVTLLAPNFKKAGYGFLGWSFDEDAYDHFTDNNNNNDPVIYGPNETVEITSSILARANGNRIITIYAVWIPALKNGNDPVYLQYWDNPATTSVAYDGCTTLTAATYNANPGTGERAVNITKNGVVALTDMRDNEVYTIAKLADGNCWMVENLRLNNQYTVGQNQNDSTMTNESLAQGYGKDPDNMFGYGEFIGLASSESDNFTSSSDAANSIYYSGTPTGTATINVGTESAAYHFPRYNNTNTTNSADGSTFTQDYTNPASPTPSGFNANVYAYGNYYSWAAAMADTYYFPKNYISADYQQTSICPKGWYVPSSSGYRDVDYGALSQAYGGTGNNQASSAGGGDMSKKIRTFPNNFMYSGSIGGSVFYRGLEGNYISSSNASNISGYQPLFFSSTQFNPKNYRANNRTYGFSIRCVSANYLTLTVTMSNVTSVTFSNPDYGSQTLTANGTVSLRQGVDYSVSYVYPAGYEGNYASVVSYYDDASFNVVGEENPYRIQYDGNGADNPTGMGVADARGVKQISHYLGSSSGALGTEETLLASNFKKSGYGFMGWSTDPYAYEHYIDNDSLNDPIIYGPNETIEITANLLSQANVSNHVITLYAAWVPAMTNGGQPIYLQDSNAVWSLCNQAYAYSYTPVMAFTDQRDNEVYAVMKGPYNGDYTCWMIENLRLDDQYTYGINQNDSTVTNDLLAQRYGVISSPLSSPYLGNPNFVGLAQSENYGFTGAPYENERYIVGSEWYASSYYVQIPNDSNSARYRIPRYNNNNTHDSLNGATFSGSLSAYSASNLYSYGNYYNYPAAMANTNRLNTAADADAAETSICPTSWEILTGGSTGEYAYMLNGISSDTARSFPFNFVYSGLYGVDTAIYRGTRGYYTSATAVDDARMYLLSLTEDELSFDDYGSGTVGKTHGHAVRCVLQPPHGQ